MIEPDASADRAAAGAVADVPGKVTAGSLLRAAREAQGLHIAALATAIKVTPRKVDALENDRLHELPDATFARALAQTMCRYLKIDPQPVMDLLPRTGTVALEPASRIQSTPYRDRGGRADPGAGAGLGPLLWGAALLLVGAALVYLVPASWLSLGQGPAATAPSGTVVTTVPNAVPPAASAVGADPAAPAAASAPTAAEAASQPSLQQPLQPVAAPATAQPAIQQPVSLAPAALPDASADRRTPAETVFAAPPPTAGAAPTVNGALVVRTTDASWVEVRDARGQVLLSETVQPGRSVGLDGALPMRLLIGNASATQLVFKGRTVDVMARSRENVARFELQ